ncbi:MAG: tRNA (adenosine(37)-N6)-threonylcarbamoyltransferase complex dimerization subunit type 1 TsaB [bacterium]|nr:tRNA (adenosine(37)-N6)-threonylcarbamoyltransferase complex dimerization subunit type 1 TsaB [bacterium]
MTLLIDTSNSEKITVGINKDVVVDDAKEGKSQRLLGIIHDKLKEKGMSLGDITKIEVNTGPGSFTGLRVGVSVANALGWLLNVPVNNKDIKKEGPIEPIYSFTKLNL